MRLSAVDNDDVSALANPSAGAAEPAVVVSDDRCAAEKSGSAFFNRRFHRGLCYLDRIGAGRRRNRGFYSIGRQFHKTLGAFEFAVFLAHLGFQAQGAASVRSEPTADFGSERSAYEAAEGPPARGSTDFAAPFNHPPTDFPMGELNVPTAFPALLMRSPKN